MSEVAQVRGCHVLLRSPIGNAMSKNRDTVEFSAKVPDDLYQEFKVLFPQYGSTTWFINTALEEFLKSVRTSASLQQHVANAIDSMLTDRREDKE